MHIIIIGTAHPYRGGLAAFNERLAGQFQEEGHQVEMYTFTLQYPGFLFPGKTQFTDDPAPKHLSIKRRINSCNPFNWISVGREIRKKNADLVIFAYWMSFMAPCFGTIARQIHKNKHTRCVGLIHNMIPHEPNILDKLFPSYFVKAMDGFTTLSQSVIHDIEKFDHSGKPKSWAPHPIYDHYGELISKEDARRQLGLDINGHYVLFFGFIRDYKGLDLLLQAFAQEELKNQNVKLIVAGEFYEDELPLVDEPQNIPEWSLFVNRLLRGGMHVLVTGSNSNLLAGELGTHMTGRYTEIKLLPFSFREYCALKKVDSTSITLKARALRSAAFDDYLRDGAFPEVAQGESPRSYVRTLIENIRTKDIERRYKIRYRSALKKLMDYVLNVVPMTPDFDELARLCGFSSRHTSENYVEYMERSFLVNRVSKYSSKPRIRMVGEKLYAVDVSFMSERDNALQGENLGWRMETIVALELLRRMRPLFKDVYYYADSGHECDFVVCDRRKVESLIQVTYDMSNPKTRKREIGGAVAAARVTGLKEATIITYSELDDIVDPSGVTVHLVPVADWLVS